MPDREKVIENLERMLSNYDMLDDIVINKNNEMLMFHRAVAKTALSLLKEQEAKCLTKAELDDLNENQFVWIEIRTGQLYCLQIIGICRVKTGISDIQFNAPTSYVERSTNTYGKTYRIWTNKPTEEQSQAVKWE